MTYNFNATEKEAAAALGWSWQLLKKKRHDGEIPSHCYVKHGYKLVRYCLPLLQDWSLAPQDLEAQARAVAALEATRPSNSVTKRGRKSAAAA
jgi:hypothetical protein